MIKTEQLKKELPGVARDVTAIVVGIVIAAVMYRALKSKDGKTNWVGWVQLFGGLLGATLTGAGSIFRGFFYGVAGIGLLTSTGMLNISTPDANGLGCGPDCDCPDCKNKYGNGLAGFDPANRNTGSVNGGVLKTNVTKADLLTLPGATQALADLVPNTDRTLYGFQFQAFFLQPDFTHKSPKVNHWELIYNFYPQLFERIASEIPNPSAVKSVMLMQNPQRTWAGALTRMPKMCAYVKVEMKDGTQKQFPYAPYGNPFTGQASICAWGTIDSGTCGQGRTPDLFFDVKQTGAIQTSNGWEVEVGQVLTFKLRSYNPSKFYYWAELSDGSGFFIDSQTFTYTFEDTGNMLLNIFAWERDFPTSAGGKICVSDGTQGFIVNPAKQAPPAPELPVSDGICERSDFTVTNKTPKPYEVITFEVVNPDPTKTYNWTFGDGTTAKGVKVSKGYPKTGDFLVTLETLCKSGETSYAVETINVGTPPTTAPPNPPPPANVTVPPTTPPNPGVNTVIPVLVGNTETVIGKEETFTVWYDSQATSEGLNESNFEWTWSDGVTQTTPFDKTPQITRTFDRPGTYTVEVCFYTEIGYYKPSGRACLKHTITVPAVKIIDTPVDTTIIQPSGKVTGDGGATWIDCTPDTPPNPPTNSGGGGNKRKPVKSPNKGSQAICDLPLT